MFENLTDRLQRTFKNLRGQGKLSDEHLDAALAEIREALLEGDVAVAVADELLANIRSKALGTEVMLQLSPDQQVVKIVRDELLNLLGKHAKPLFASRPPSVWMIVGVQGSGGRANQAQRVERPRYRPHAGHLNDRSRVRCPKFSPDGGAESVDRPIPNVITRLNGMQRNWGVRCWERLRAGFGIGPPATRRSFAWR